MPHTTMLTSVLQASALGILTTLVEHYSLENVFLPFEEYQEAYKANRSQAVLQEYHERWGTSPHNFTTSVGNETTNASVSVSNITLSGNNATSSNSLPSADPPKGFLTSVLPKDVFTILLTAVLRYYWLLWLERILPARPRAPARSRPAEKEEDDDSREEEVIRKWIEAGKVRRASLSWFNTFAKWILDLTVGNFCMSLLMMIVRPTLEWEWFWGKWDKWELLFHFGSGLFGVAPLATLIAFILIPAHKRIVFEASIDLAFKVFFGAFMHVLIPWVVERDTVQQVLRNMTDGDLPGGESAPLGHVGGDEL